VPFIHNPQNSFNSPDFYHFSLHNLSITRVRKARCISFRNDFAANNLRDFFHLSSFGSFRFYIDSIELKYLLYTDDKVIILKIRHSSKKMYKKIFTTLTLSNQTSSIKSMYVHFHTRTGVSKSNVLEETISRKSKKLWFWLRLKNHPGKKISLLELVLG
jgi:hypothetical protein